MVGNCTLTDLSVQNIFIDPIVSARKKAEKRGRHEEREKERKRRCRLMMALTPKRLFLSLSLSSCLPLFSAFFLALTIWVNKYILKNACELQRVVLYFKDLSVLLGFHSNRLLGICLEKISNNATQANTSHFIEFLTDLVEN